MITTTSVSYSSPATSQSIPLTATGDTIFEQAIPVAGGASAAQKVCAFPLTGLQSCFLLFTAGTNPGATKTLTVKTNSSGSPTDTITLTSGVPVLYVAGGPWAAPISGAVTTIYVTDNTSNAVGGTLTISALSNQ